MNKLISILIFIAVLVLFLRFGLMIFRIGLRYWFITIPIVLFFYWKPKEKPKRQFRKEDTDLDPQKEIKPTKKPTVIDEEEEK